MFRLPALFGANLYKTWLPLQPPWRSSLRATEMLSPQLGLLNIPTKEANTIYRLWLIFFSQHLIHTLKTNWLLWFQVCRLKSMILLHTHLSVESMWVPHSLQEHKIPCCSNTQAIEFFLRTYLNWNPEVSFVCKWLKNHHSPLTQAGLLSRSWLWRSHGNFGEVWRSSFSALSCYTFQPVDIRNQRDPSRAFALWAEPNKGWMHTLL